MSEEADSDVRQASKQAAEWLEEYAQQHGLNLDEFQGGDWFILAMKVPCSIRCWRVGVSIEVDENEKCPECGKLNEVTLWEKLGRSERF